jgi:hypothetical protein
VDDNLSDRRILQKPEDKNTALRGFAGFFALSVDIRLSLRTIGLHPHRAMVL